MKPLKAISVLKDHQAHWERLLREHIAPAGEAKEFINAVDVSIAAIRKQVPMQVDLEGDGYDPEGNLIYDMGYCPNPDCGQEFEDGDENWECNYCPTCGQALKWFETEEEG